VLCLWLRVCVRACAYTRNNASQAENSSVHPPVYLNPMHNVCVYTCTHTQTCTLGWSLIGCTCAGKGHTHIQTHTQTHTHAHTHIHTHSLSLAHTHTQVGCLIGCTCVGKGKEMYPTFDKYGGKDALGWGKSHTLFLENHTQYC